MKNIPEWLFRYRPLTEVDREIRMIKENHIWLSDPTGFDDPWDCSFSLMTEDIKKKRIKRSVGQIRVACFAERDDNTRMWSHYASRHFGFCLGYYTPHDHALFSSGDFEQVKYTNIPPQPLEENSEESEQFESIRTALSTKSTDWKDQKEWRYIGGIGNSNYLPFDFDALQTITFGLRCDDAVKKYIIKEIFKFRCMHYKEVYMDPASMTPKVRSCRFQDPQIDEYEDPGFDIKTKELV
jgi:hypothetical protein